MLNDLFIINEGGQLIYSWHHVANEESDDDLVSGFLTALNNFATLERGEDIKSLQLKETTIIFKKFNKYKQKLTFVATTKDNKLVELIYVFLKDLILKFSEKYVDILNVEFNGEIGVYESFNQDLENLMRGYGLDLLESTKKQIDGRDKLKAILYLDSNSGEIYYTHAKTYIAKEKFGFLLPLLINSANLICKNRSKEALKWVLISSIKNENLLIENREHMVILRWFELSQQFKDKIMALDLIEKNKKYSDKPKKLEKIFNGIEWDKNIQKIIVFDMLGKNLYSKSISDDTSCEDIITESVSFLNSSQKTSQDICGSMLHYSVFGNEEISIIFLNFVSFGLAMIGNVQDLKHFDRIQNICLSVIDQL